MLALEPSSLRLQRALEALASFSDRPEIGPAIKEELGELYEQVSAVEERVREIEGLYAIDYTDTVDSKIEDANEIWDATPAGTVSGKQLEAIRKASPLLSELHVNGLDFPKAQKFSDQEAKLSSWIGDNIDSMSNILHSFRRERRNPQDETEFTILTHNQRALDLVLNGLKKDGVLQGRRILTKSKEGRWLPFKWEWLRDDPKQEIMIVYEKTDAGLAQLLKGEWMNSYVHSIIADQLSRREIPFELYTNVEYKVPADVTRSKSDFDVIGRFRDRIVCVECKSGRLEAGRGHFKYIKQRTEHLQNLISSVGFGDAELMFFLVYDPDMTKEQVVQKQLENEPITPLKLNEVRAIMAQTLNEAIS